MPGTAEDVANLVPHQFLDPDAGRTEVFARVKLFGILEEGLSDGRCHRQAQVRVNVYFSAAGTAGDLDVLLGNTSSVSAQLAAVLVDFLDQILGHTGGAWRTSG